MFALPCSSVLCFIVGYNAIFLRDNVFIRCVVRLLCVVMTAVHRFVLGTTTDVGMIRVATWRRGERIWTS